MIRALAVLLTLSSAALAQSDPAITAQRASAMLDAAATSLAEADGARDRVAALTETIRAYEEGLIAVREGLRRAGERERALALSFEAERDRLARLLGALQAIERAPAPLLMLHPDGPVGTARSGMMLAHVTPSVAAEALALRAQLEDLALMRRLQDSAQEELSTALGNVQAARAELSEAIADRVDLPPRFENDPDAIRQLLDAAETLGAFAEALRANPVAATRDLGAPRFAEARELPLPVLGRLLRPFNTPDAAGILRPGWLIAARPRALVTAPWTATVRYAGPLSGHGNVVILEPDGQHMIVLGGLGDLYVATGDITAQGDALGLMGGAAPTSDNLIVTNVLETGASLSETLYIEVRYDDDPSDPARWFRADRDEE